MSGLFGDWGKLNQWLSDAHNRLPKAIDKGNLRAAHVLQKRIRQGIRSQAPAGQAFEPNSHHTIAQKGGATKALIAKGELMREIKVQKESNNEIWVGVKAGLKKGNSKKGEGIDIARLAWVHENGMTIEVHRGKSVSYIRIPARPFLSPIFSDPEAQNEMCSEYVKVFKEVLQL